MQGYISSDLGRRYPSGCRGGGGQRANNPRQSGRLAKANDKSLRRIRRRPVEHGIVANRAAHTLRPHVPYGMAKAGLRVPRLHPGGRHVWPAGYREEYRAVQGRGGHYGRPGGGRPLHRNSSQQETDNNRHLVCPKHLKRPPGDQCDEYPFASAWEGGTRLPPIDRYRGWVPKRENSVQGAILKRFYADNRILRGSPGDAYYVHV